MTRTAIGWTIAGIGLVFPIVAAIALSSAPSIVTREGDAGEFLTANVTPCGFGCDTMTTVHTTRGTFIVTGAYPAALIGSAMAIRDTTGGGFELCTRGEPDSCAGLASGYAGALHPVGHAPFGLSYGVRTAGLWICAFWFPLGLLVLIVFFVGGEDDDTDHDVSHEAADL